MCIEKCGDFGSNEFVDKTCGRKTGFRYCREDCYLDSFEIVRVYCERGYTEILARYKL